MCYGISKPAHGLGKVWSSRVHFWFGEKQEIRSLLPGSARGFGDAQGNLRADSGQGNLRRWRSRTTPRKHGVADEDIEHAVRNAIRIVSQADRDLYIGADRTGRLLEVVVLDDDGQPVAIHAMALRPKFYEHL